MHSIDIMLANRQRATLKCTLLESKTNNETPINQRTELQPEQQPPQQQPRHPKQESCYDIVIAPMTP
jgi:hypothetical protein